MEATSEHKPVSIRTPTGIWARDLMSKDLSSRVQIMSTNHSGIAYGMQAWLAIDSEEEWKSV
jgi:hypothetical protein